jgi:hypothetical protein
MPENIRLKMKNLILPIAFYGCEICFLFSCGLYCDALSTSEYMTPKGRIAVSDNKEGSDSVPAELLSWYLPAEIEERYRISQSEYPMSWSSNRAPLCATTSSTCPVMQGIILSLYFHLKHYMFRP